MQISVTVTIVINYLVKLPAYWEEWNEGLLNYCLSEFRNRGPE